MSKTDHVRIGNVGRHYRLICTHCGAHYDPALPCGIDMFLAIGRQFESEHKDCQPQVDAPAVGGILARPSIQHGLAKG